MASSGWRKKKLGNISRLLSSMARRKMGDSRLVVQAGFPTAIADLVVKNRSRLRNSLRKISPGGADSTDVSTPEDDGIGEEMTEDDLPLFGFGENEIVVEGKGESSLDRGFYVKIGFIFLVLALVTKKIALGISISAIIVIFVESLGRRLIILFRSCKELKENRRIGDFRGSQIPQCSVEVEEDPNSGDMKIQEEDEHEIGPSFGVSSKIDGAVADFPAEMVIQSRNQTSRRLILLLFVLFGLVGGRFAAMATTITLYSLGTSARRLLKNLKRSMNQH